MTTKQDAKITYATMTADQMDALHGKLDSAVAAVQKDFGQTHPNYIEGRPVTSPEQFDDTSPHDTRILLGRFQKATRKQVRDAIRAARAAADEWSALPWPSRVAAVRRLADAIRNHRWEISALMGYEASKNRLECVGDVEETADLITYYCDQVEANGGFVKTMGQLGPEEENVSVLRPHGVWAVISPFNFPMALAGGPAGGALVAGNTVVFKPASDTPYVGLKLYDMTVEAGLPPGVFNFVTGDGATTGQALVDSADIDGIVFTGSYAVGMKLMRDNASRPIPRPIIAEMGGKNPALVMASADLDKAAEGVMRSAFGAQGQKCSACSRAYVARKARKRFTELLVEKTRQIKTGNPLERDVWHGPLINERAVAIFEQAVEEARRDGGRILTGGRRLTEDPYTHGYFCEPTVIDGLPMDHRLLTEELFAPITVLAEVSSFDEALALANRTEYGLTAGIFSEDEAEITRFFDRMQAGVLYANRRANATAGAWPGINPFGGWKGSGSSGRGSGGPYYVQQFMREQSRVRIRG